MPSPKVPLVVLLLACTTHLVFATGSAWAADCGGATVCGCGDTVTASTTLTADLDCTGHPATAALFIDTGITLDGNGHTITKLDNDGNGVDIQASVVTVTDIKIVTGTGAAIYLPLGGSVTVSDADLSNDDAGTQIGFGIRAQNSGATIHAYNVQALNRFRAVAAYGHTGDVYQAMDLSNSVFGFDLEVSSNGLSISDWTCVGCTYGAYIDNATNLTLGHPTDLTGTHTGIFLNGGSYTFSGLQFADYDLNTAIGMQGNTILDISNSNLGRTSTTRVGFGINAGQAASRINVTNVQARNRDRAFAAYGHTGDVFDTVDASNSNFGFDLEFGATDLLIKDWTCNNCGFGIYLDQATNEDIRQPLGLSGPAGSIGIYANGTDLTLSNIDLSGFSLPGTAIGAAGATLRLANVNVSGAGRVGFGLQLSNTTLLASNLTARDRNYGVYAQNTKTGSSVAGADVSGSYIGLSFGGGGGLPNFTLTNWTAKNCDTAAEFAYPSNLTLGHPVDLTGSVNGLKFDGGDVTLSNLDFSAYGLTGTAVANIGQPYYTFTISDSNLSGSGAGAGLSVRQSLVHASNITAQNRSIGVDLHNTPPGSYLDGGDMVGSATGIQLASNGGTLLKNLVLGGGADGIAGGLGTDNVFSHVRITDVTRAISIPSGSVALDHVVVDGAQSCLSISSNPGVMTVVSSTFHACSVSAISAASGATVAVDSSIVWPSGSISGAGTISIQYSDLPTAYAGTGNISADPLFVDAAAGDLTLGPGSPARDAGNPALGTPPAGQGPLYDMGAFEAAFIDDCPDDPDKTTPGVCGCGVPDLDADSDGAYECRYVVRMFDTSGVELSAASFSTEDGQSTISGGTLRFEQGATVRLRSTWRNANFWSAFFIVPSTDTNVTVIRGDPPNAIGSVQTVSAAPGGLRIDVVVDRGPLTITVVDATGVTLPSTDAFGNPVGAPSVTTDAPYLFSGPSGSSGEVAFGHVMRFNGRWMSAGLWPFITPLRATAFTVHGSEAGAPVTSAAAAEAAVIFEYDKITITIDAITPAGDPVPEATVGVEGFGFHPSPFRFEGPAGPPGNWWVRLNHSHTLYGPRYPYIYLVKGAVLSLDGTNPESWVSAGGQTVHIVYPPISVCGDGEIEGDEVCDDGNTADGDCCDASCTAAAAIGTACGSQAFDACDDPDTCDGAGGCLSNTETLDSDDDGVRDCEDACPLVHPATCASTFYVTVTTPTGLGQIACEVVGGEVSCARNGEVAVVVPVSQDTTCP